MSSAGPIAAEAGLAALLAMADLRLLADIGATAPDWAVALHQRHDCDVVVIDLDKDGAFAGATPSRRAADYVARLAAAGVASGRVKVIGSPGAIRPADALVSLNGFGDRWKIKHLAPVLARALHADSRMVIDVRKGSGAFPFLADYGSNEALAQGVRDDKPVTRILFTPDAPPPPAPAEDDGWAEIARRLAGPDGFYTEGNGHSFLFIPRDPDTLVVTFDNLDIAMNKRENRRPWGFEFIEKQGWSMLGAMAAGWTWYRDPFPLAEFARLRDEGFFRRFKRVVFYGASMGGYAASAFAPACPGCEVVAISPQSTVDKTLVPWETRYRSVWGRDFTGPFGDAAEVSAAAARVTILFDPYEPLDRAHADRFTGANVVKLRCPLMGHRLGSSLSQMGLLTPTILGALSGTLTPADFYRNLRVRRDFPRYQKELFDRAVARGHLRLALRMGRWVLARADNRHIRHEMKRLAAEGHR